MGASSRLFSETRCAIQAGSRSTWYSTYVVKVLPSTKGAKPVDIPIGNEHSLLKGVLTRSDGSRREREDTRHRAYVLDDITSAISENEVCLI